MVGGMSILGIRLYFLNLLAFPIALGNGVDYTVNVVQRYNAELAEGQSAPSVSVQVVTAHKIITGTELTIAARRSSLDVFSGAL
jgi:uncharacterized membrane protein YdfJ with MMPL/SSD domain